MKTQITLVLATITTLTMTSHTLAAGQINFTGEIVNAACDVKINNSSNNEIVLGKWPTSMFKAKGDKSTAQPFTIDVANCVAGNYQVNFSGATDTSDPDLLKTSAATGVGIAIANTGTTTTLVKFNSTAGQASNATFTAVGTGITATGSLPLQAFYQATGGQVAAGKADATVSVTLQLK